MGALMTETRSSGLDVVKLLLALVVLVAGLFGFYYFKPAEGDAAVAGLTAARVGGLVFAILVSLFIVSRTEKGARAWAFMTGSRVEVRKMVWPTRAETVQTTIVVVIAVIILSIFLFLIDKGLGSLVDSFIVGGGDKNG